MYKKGREPNPCNYNMEQYIERMTKIMRPILKKKTAAIESSFVNSRELDDMICDDLKNDKTKIDGIHRWIEIHRSIRIRIIVTTLIKELGFTMWSGKSRKVLCKPALGFKRASELKKRGG